MLSGKFEGIGPSMFPNLAPDMRPDPEEMEKAAEAARFHKTVSFSDHVTNTYHLNDAKDLKKFNEDMLIVMQGLQLKTHMLLWSDRRFEGDHYIAHLQWVEFEEKVTETAPVGSGALEE